MRNVYRPVHVYPALVVPCPCGNQQLFSVNFRKDKTAWVIGFAGLDKVIKHASQLFRVLKACPPLIEEIAKTCVVLAAPTPRYITGKCCNDPGHIENFSDKDFEESVMAVVELAKSILETWGTELGLNYVLIDPMLITNPGDLELRMRKTSVGTPIWCVRDYVHLTSDGYKDIADTYLTAILSRLALSIRRRPAQARHHLGRGARGKWLNRWSQYRGRGRRQIDASCNRPRQQVGSWESMPNQKMKIMVPLGAEEEGGLMGGDSG